MGNHLGHDAGWDRLHGWCISGTCMGVEVPKRTTQAKVRKIETRAGGPRVDEKDQKGN